MIICRIRKTTEYTKDKCELSLTLLKKYYTQNMPNRAGKKMYKSDTTLTLRETQKQGRLTAWWGVFISFLAHARKSFLHPRCAIGQSQQFYTITIGPFWPVLIGH